MKPPFFYCLFCILLVHNNSFSQDTAVKQDSISGYQKVYNNQNRLWKEGAFKQGELYEGKLYERDKRDRIFRQSFVMNGKCASVKEGIFVDGQLLRGKQYEYDESGSLVKTTEYEKARPTKEYHEKNVSQDTLNRVDSSGKKYGWWRVYGIEHQWMSRGYTASAVVEEGMFTDGKKTGTWKMYYPSGKLKNEVEHKNGRPGGKFTTYYENGCVNEKGDWKNNAYKGRFYRYREDSCQCLYEEKMFNDAGKSDWYIYYRKDRCNVKDFEGLTKDGKKHHITYDKQGNVLKDSIDNSVEKPLKPAKVGGGGGSKMPDEKYCCEKLYDDQKRLVQEGEFKDGKLWNGKWYFYDKNGLISKVEIYKNGHYFKDAELE